LPDLKAIVEKILHLKTAKRHIASGH